MEEMLYWPVRWRGCACWSLRMKRASSSASCLATSGPTSSRSNPSEANGVVTSDRSSTTSPTQAQPVVLDFQHVQTRYHPRHFLKIVDGFHYGIIDFAHIRALARGKDSLIKAITEPRVDRSRAEQAPVGIERFLLFCNDLLGLLTAAGDSVLEGDVQTPHRLVYRPSCR
jgi:hypothetical protein